MSFEPGKIFLMDHKILHKNRVRGVFRNLTFAYRVGRGGGVNFILKYAHVIQLFFVGPFKD